MKYAVLVVGMAMLTCGAVLAQTETRLDPDGEMIVTGTRVSRRAALESSAPVDVVSGETIADTGFPDLAARRTSCGHRSISRAPPPPLHMNHRAAGLSDMIYLIIPSSKRVGPMTRYKDGNG